MTGTDSLLQDLDLPLGEIRPDGDGQLDDLIINI